MPAFAPVLRPLSVAALAVFVVDGVGNDAEPPETMFVLDLVASTIAELSENPCKLDERVVGEEVASGDLVVEDKGAAFGVLRTVVVSLVVDVGVGVEWALASQQLKILPQHLQQH